MPVITCTILVDAPVEFTFDISNRVDQWPEMIPEYLKSEIFRRVGRTIWFRLTNLEGASWVSWRMLLPPLVAYAERHDPIAPFAFNQITWTYAALPGNRSQMTWDMCFELDDEHKPVEAEWVARMTEHTEANQEAMRMYIESLAKQEVAT